MRGKSIKTIGFLFVVAVMMVGNGTASAKVEVTSPIFQAPIVSISTWNGDYSQSVTLQIVDRSNCEIGYKIYRYTNSFTLASLLKDTISIDPSLMNDTMVFTDTTIHYNGWYRYKVFAYKNDSSIYSITCSTFTFHFTAPHLQRAFKFQKISDFTISDSASFSALKGDSIILKDKSSPVGKYSAINVKNSSLPKFAGYIDSTVLLNYPLRSLIPIFIRYGVSNNYANSKVVTCRINNNERIIISKGNTVRMFGLSAKTLVEIDSLTIHCAGDTNLSLLLLNDSTLLIHVVNVFNTGTGNDAQISLNIVAVSDSKFGQPFAYSPQYLFHQYYGLHGDYGFYGYRPYYHYSNNKVVLITTDTYQRGWMYQGVFIPLKPFLTTAKDCAIIDLASNAISNVSYYLPFANAYNTGHYFADSEVVCTNGFSFGCFNPSNIPTELFVSHITDPSPHTTDSLRDLIYRDTVHSQSTLQNIMLDTVKKHVFLIFKNNISILSYQNQTVGIATISQPLHGNKRIFIRPDARSSFVTIILPSHSAPATLSIFDLSGRLVDQIPNITSNAVLWKPKTRSVNCYIVKAVINGRNYSEKFVVR